jgi:hypothetical protein
MRKMRVEMPSNPQQNCLGMESNAPIAVDVGTLPGLLCGRPAASGSLDTRAMRAVSFFGLGWVETEAKFGDVAGLSAAVESGALGGSDGGREVTAAFASGCKIGEAGTCAGNAGGRRTGIRGDPAREAVLTDDGRMTGVVSSFWGSAL